MNRQVVCGLLLVSGIACARAYQSSDTGTGVNSSDAAKIARGFISHQPDSDQVSLDSAKVEQDSRDWQVYFFRKDKRVPPFELVAVNKRSGVARRVPVR